MDKRITLGRLLSVLVLLAITTIVRAQDPNFYIYLAIGQSNMVGQAPILAEDSVVSDRFLNMTASDCDVHPMGQWRKAVPPLARQWTKLCPVDYFGRTMLQNLPEDKKIGTILVAVDGCSIRLFHPDSCAKWTAGALPDWQRNEVNCYGGKPLERLLTLARKAQKDGVIKGILLHQGETDAYDDRWLRMVKELYQNLLTELNLKAEDCPIIAGETVDSTFNGVCAHALPTIRRLPEWIPTSYVVSSKGCSPLTDNVHFSRDGYINIGKRYAYAALSHLGIKAKDDTRYDVVGNANFGIEHHVKEGQNGRELIVISEKNYHSVEIVSYSGKTIFTHKAERAPGGGEKVEDIKFCSFPLKDVTDRVLIIVVNATDGTISTKKIEL